MIFWRKSAKIKELEAEIREMKRQLGTERRRVVEESDARQKAEIQLWKRESELKGLNYRERKIKDVLKREYWEKLFPVFFMEEQELRMVVRKDLISHDKVWNCWNVIEGYCVICGNVTEYRTFKTEKDALRYAACRQALGIAPIFTTCDQCYYNQLIECA